MNSYSKSIRQSKYNLNDNNYGFSKLNPYSMSNHDVYNNMIDNSDEMKKAFIDMVFENKPYYFFITLTFKAPMSANKRIYFANMLLRYYNDEIFNKNWYKNNRNLDGFAFIEDHLSNKFKDHLHIHLLIKDNSKYHTHCLSHWQNKLHKASDKVNKFQKRSVFNNDNIDIQLVHDDGIIRYCFEQIFKYNLDNVKPLSKDGLADNIYVGNNKYY